MPTTESRAAAAAAGMSPPFRGPPFATSPPTKFGFLTAVRASGFVQNSTAMLATQREHSAADDKSLSLRVPLQLRVCGQFAKMAVWKGVFFLWGTWPHARTAQVNLQKAAHASNTVQL